MVAGDTTSTHRHASCVCANDNADRACANCIGATHINQRANRATVCNADTSANGYAYFAIHTCATSTYNNCVANVNKKSARDRNAETKRKDNSHSDGGRATFAHNRAGYACAEANTCRNISAAAANGHTRGSGNCAAHAGCNASCNATSDPTACNIRTHIRATHISASATDGGSANSGCADTSSCPHRRANSATRAHRCARTDASATRTHPSPATYRCSCANTSAAAVHKRTTPAAHCAAS